MLNLNLLVVTNNHCVCAHIYLCVAIHYKMCNLTHLRCYGQPEKKKKTVMSVEWVIKIDNFEGIFVAHFCYPDGGIKGIEGKNVMFI